MQAQIKENIKIRVTGLCEGNPPLTGGFPPQRASNAEKFPFDDVILCISSHTLMQTLPHSYGTHSVALSYQFDIHNMQPHMVTTQGLPHVSNIMNDQSYTHTLYRARTVATSCITSSNVGLVWATLRWRHNRRDGVSNHQPHDCLLNSLFGMQQTEQRVVS